MGKHTFLSTGLAAALLFAGAPAAHAFQSTGPVRIVTAPGPRATSAQPLRRVLADSLGGRAASSPVGAPDNDTAGLARQFAPRDAAARSYGDARVTLYLVPDESVAHALARAVRPAGGEPVAVGGGGWANADATAFWLGPYAVTVEGPASSRDAVVSALTSRIGSPSAPAPLLGHLPGDGRIAGTERYLPSFDALRRARPDLAEDVFRLEAGGAEAVVAQYEQPGAAPFLLTLVEYETPQLAAEAERRLKAWHGALPEGALAGRLTRREGNYLVEAINVADEALVGRVLGAVNYAYQVKWLKEPPMPLPAFDVAGEGRKVAQVLLSSFAIVGIGLLSAACLGIVFGAGMFRLRRRGIGNTYSDAGGMVCLDLDPALPPTATPRLLGKGED
jgi:hypothetical protein